MRILFVSSHFPGIPGGVADYTYNLSKAMARQGAEVIVLTTDHLKIRKDNDLTVLPLVRQWNVFSIFNILKIIRTLRPDRIVFQYVPYMYSYYGAPLFLPILAGLLRIQGFYLVTTLHEVSIRPEIKRPKYWIIFLFQRFIALNLIFWSQKVIVPIEFYKRLLWPFSKNIISMPNGSNITPFSFSGDEKNSLRSKIACSSEIVVSTFSSKAPWFKTDLLIRSVKRFEEKTGVSTKLLILGATELLKEKEWTNLKKLVQGLNYDKNVIFTGFLEEQEVFQLLSISDLFMILDCHSYGGVSGRNSSMMAAFAAGLPVIGNKGPYTDNWLIHRENICLVNSLEIDEIANTIQTLLSNKDLQSRIAKASFKIYTDLTNWNRTAERYLSLIK